MRIFKKVHCKGYLKKIDDGISLSCEVPTAFGYAPAQGHAWDHPIKVTAQKGYVREGFWKTECIKDLSDFEDGYVEKTYRERVSEDFFGFLVGITHITTTGKIGTSYSEVPYDMDGRTREVYHLTKETHQEKVGVVYFRNNAKRYVLLDDMEEVEE